MAKGVTREQIIEAAETLLVREQKVSARSVRKYLGDTGSHDTILPVLQAWQAQQQQTVVSAVTVPERLLDRLTVIAREIMAAGQAEGETHLGAVRAQMQAAQQQAEARRNEALELADELQADVTRLEGQLAESVSGAEALREDLLTSRGNEERAREFGQVAAARGAELERHVVALTGELERLHAVVEADRREREREREATAQQHLAELTRRDEEARQRLDETRSDAERRATDLHSRLEETRRELEQRAAELAAQLADVRHERQALREELVAAREQIRLDRERADEAHRVQQGELAAALEQARTSAVGQAAAESELEGLRAQVALLQALLTHQQPATGTSEGRLS